ncbi:hypothetical protein GLYMA_14G013800v4 [Glycine max]|uniref:Transmembrane protein n=3 Tax=Glycine subgen. Soja TaxID=1462606 RepID=K7M4C4_SOYBN|nr:hypothetical protein GYH30_038712 [Glycine max]KHN23845.1 hypothetical protein glysoja_028138 [Glycine soja]KRH14229.1 hypothetical protein GLYMA_14G013800v4 [Glycine max]
MVKVTKQQICHNLCCYFASFLPIILVLVLLFSISFFFSVSESFPSLLTLLIALLSTLFLVTLAKKKGSLHENLVQDNQQNLELQPSLGDVTVQQNETSERQAEAHSESSFPLDCESSNIMDTSFELSARKYEQQADPQSDSSLPSDSESTASSTMDEESIEIHRNRNQNLDISDSLVFDYDVDGEEDGLIEIKLPNNHFPEFLPESIFKQQGLTELLAEINEMNEDENLIEIDISKGSTKHQDLRLEKELVCRVDHWVLSD